MTSLQLYHNLTNPSPGSGTTTVSLGMVDVRDVALAHALALEHPEAGGERFIVSNGPFSWAELRKSPTSIAGFFETLLTSSRTYRYRFTSPELVSLIFRILKVMLRSKRVSRVLGQGLQRSSFHRSPNSLLMVAKHLVCLASNIVRRVRLWSTVSSQSTSSILKQHP